MAIGDIKTNRFKNHSPASSPSAGQLQSHYAHLDMAAIRNQTNFKTAGWFLAELDEAPAFGGVEGELYLIYNPRNGTNAITSATLASAKVCGAPNPPFNGEDGTD